MTTESVISVCVTTTMLSALYQFGVFPVFGWRGFVGSLFGMAFWLLIRRTGAR